jgi:hypothetical protein
MSQGGRALPGGLFSSGSISDEHFADIYEESFYDWELFVKNIRKNKEHADSQINGLDKALAAIELKYGTPVSSFPENDAEREEVQNYFSLQEARRWYSRKEDMYLSDTEEADRVEEMMRKHP